jgi:hypothetical protein
MLRCVSAVSLVALVAAAAVSCASPTLPLPPPLLPTEGPGPDADHVRLSAPCGGVEPDAVIIILNENPNLPGDEAVSGSLANTCGEWDAIVYAHTGDVLQITQEQGTSASSATIVQVQ